MPDWDIPFSGWVEVTVDGDRLTKVQVEAGETIAIEMLDEDD